MKWKKIFSFQRGLTSFTYPLVKIVVSLAIIISEMICKRIFDLSSTWANLVFAIQYFALAMACVLCLIISIAELRSVISNRKSANAQHQKVKKAQKTQKAKTVKPVPIQTVIDLVSRYDIIEIEACCGNKTFKLGSSAESEYRGAPLKNKLFYIANAEYETTEPFEQALFALFPNGIIPVWKIDDVPVKDWNLDDPSVE